MNSDADKAAHAKNAELARNEFLRNRTPIFYEDVWHSALSEAQGLIAAALQASNMLTQVDVALGESGKHMRVFRHLTAPPISQDQFKLACSSWSKSSEVKGTKVKAAIAAGVADVFHQWRDKSITKWLEEGRIPNEEELRRLYDAISPLIASQEINTVERNRLAAQQEGAVMDLLLRKGWTKEPSKLIDTRAALPAKHFMRKTRFATRTQPQEVDIACGLAGTYVLAMECKATNDETNSVKRVNDVLKKATAWKDHWGSFIRTAALLQGVIAAKDVNRLLDAGVNVFWSHDLATFEAWLDSQL